MIAGLYARLVWPCRGPSADHHHTLNPEPSGRRPDREPRRRPRPGALSFGDAAPPKVLAAEELERGPTEHQQRLKHRVGLGVELVQVQACRRSPAARGPARLRESSVTNSEADNG
jgi:hypothetical protein